MGFPSSYGTSKCALPEPEQRTQAGHGGTSINHAGAVEARLTNKVCDGKEDGHNGQLPHFHAKIECQQCMPERAAFRTDRAEGARKAEAVQQAEAKRKPRAASAGGGR